MNGILAEPHIRGKQVTDKTVKQAIDMPYTDYYLTNRRARNAERQLRWQINTSKFHFI